MLGRVEGGRKTMTAGLREDHKTKEDLPLAA